MLATMTLPGTFCFYSLVSLVGCAVLYFHLPETEGRTLFEIGEHFSGGRRLSEKNVSTDVDAEEPSGTVNKGFQECSEIPEHIRDSAAIGIKRYISDKSKLNNDENQNSSSQTTHV